jgi:putative ABC transport system permease protein
MLELKNIVKNYAEGENTVRALRGVSLQFRESDFVSVLGPSGCGKTTMLNIIGGLDRYTQGDLVINGISTRQYRDGDCDHYRNNSIGFVFQSYNLIPHQSVLSNVELALTLAGISRKERRRRSVAMLEKVGLKRYKIYPKANETACSSLIFDPKVFKGGVVFDENTETRVFKSSEQEYFHPDFHSSMNMGLLYVGQTHGTEVVRDYLTRYAKNVYAKVIADARVRGLAAIEKLISTTYQLEKASDALHIENDGKSMSVSISHCPAVKHLRATGREVCEWFALSTEAVMQTIANESGIGFEMISYDAQTGAAKYTFEKE